jgi:AcrR family transcriptional regulator
MPRAIPSDRVSQLIAAATDVFIAQGYRRTQIEDIAQALGVAKGTIYGAVQSKEALFDAVLRYADGLESLPDTSALPLPTPEPGSTLAWLRVRLGREAHDLELTAALQRTRVRDGRSELASVLRDLYERMERNRRGIKLVDRCSLDQPELAALWFGEGRWAQHAALAQYLERRIAKGHLRDVGDTAIAARLLLETVAFWAVHRHWDPSPQQLIESDVKANVIELLVRSFEKA